MTMPRRPRRQGVVYGPPSFRRQPDASTAFGRLIGAIVVIGSLLALLVGALAVIGSGGRPLVTPKPTLAALASPSPMATAALPTPAPTPTPTAQPSPTPTASPFLVELVEGPGKITFAESYTKSLKLVNTTVDFSTTGPIAWRANVGQPLGTGPVDFTVSLVDTTTGAETTTYHETFTPSNGSAVLYYSHSRVERLTSGPGIYVMRYVDNGTVVSEGYFRVNA
jgi:hypothetical protein